MQDHLEISLIPDSGISNTSVMLVKHFQIILRGVFYLKLWSIENLWFIVWIKDYKKWDAGKAPEAVISEASHV